MMGPGFRTEPIWLRLDLGVFDTELWGLDAVAVDGGGKLLGMLERAFLEGAVLAWEDCGV